LRPDRPGVGPTFRKLLTAYAIQTLGEGVVLAALPLIAATLTSDARLVAMVSLFLELPWLILSLPLGAIIDRADRRRIIIVTQVAQALIGGAVALSVWLGHVPFSTLLILAAALGTGDILFMGSSKAIIPRVVPSEALESANGLNVTAETIGRSFAGPALGAALFAVTPGLPFWFIVVTYGISAAIVLSVRSRPEFHPAKSSSGPRASIIADIRTGATWLIRHRVLRVIAIMAAISNFCVFMGQSTLVLFATQDLRVDAAAYGILLASMAVGGVVGGLLSGRIARRFGPRTLVPAVAAASAGSLLAIGLFGRAAWSVALLFCVWSFGLSVWNVVAQSLSQRIIPNELMGRVGSASRMLAFGALPLGALAGGFIGHAYGLRAVWVIGGLLHLAATAVAVRPISRWRPEQLRPAAAGDGPPAAGTQLVVAAQAEPPAIIDHPGRQDEL
jgi:predicted MFS family arabinose efflux permease